MCDSGNNDPRKGVSQWQNISRRPPAPPQPGVLSPYLCPSTPTAGTSRCREYRAISAAVMPAFPRDSRDTSSPTSFLLLLQQLVLPTLLLLSTCVVFGCTAEPEGCTGSGPAAASRAAILARRASFSSLRFATAKSCCSGCYRGFVGVVLFSRKRQEKEGNADGSFRDGRWEGETKNDERTYRI